MKVISRKILPASLLAIATIVPISLKAQSDFARSEYDQLQAFGFATCDSRTDSNSSLEKITGGGAYTYEEAVALLDNPESGKKVKVLTADKVNKDDDIKNAIKNNDIVILDGSKGDFVIKRFITIQNQGTSTGCNNKTILGINNARLVTEWYVTPDVLDILREADVESASTHEGTGGTLPNGVVVDEEAEYLTRKALYEKYGNENYREAGIFCVKRCKNIIFRNLSFIGPGSIDCGGYDLLAVQYSSNVWVDHCEFIDGIDGNFDISNESDMITASWNEFSYTDRSLMHQNTNLVGSSDSKVGDDDKLSITFAFNSWGAKCRARMPMARYGRFHMLNNYFHCKGNSTACINPRKNSEFLIEGNYFEEGVKKIFDMKEATSVIWADDNVTVESFSKPVSFGECYIPYSYTKMPTDVVKEDVKAFAGPTIWGSTKYSVIPTDEVTGINTTIADNSASEATYNLLGQKVNAYAKGIVVKGGKKFVVR
jgi:pectate lyase